MPTRSELVDRAAGVLLGEACGDALGVPYEMAAPPVGEAVMKGGGLGPYDPGEWSDDTQMTLCVAQTAARGIDLTSPPGLDAVAEAFVAWLGGGATDVGTQTRTVLSDAATRGGAPHERLTAASDALHARTGLTAGNGALMRTSIVGIAAVDDRRKTAAAARAVARLTHADPLASDSSVLWSEAIRVAVTQGRLDLAAGLDLVSTSNVEHWSDWIEEATAADPGAFRDNGFTVTALQAAWAAITSTNRGDGSAMHLQRGLQAAVRAGHDTDTVAAIAGSLLGARYGSSAVPTQWRRMVHGWPGYRAHDLVELAVSTVGGGRRGRVVALGRDDARLRHPDPGRPAPHRPRHRARQHQRPSTGWRASTCRPSCRCAPSGSVTSRPPGCRHATTSSSGSTRTHPHPETPETVRGRRAERRTTRTLTSFSTTRRRRCASSGPRANGCSCTVASGRAPHPGGGASVCGRPGGRPRAGAELDQGGAARHPGCGSPLGGGRARRVSQGG